MLKSFVKIQKKMTNLTIFGYRGKISIFKRNSENLFQNAIKNLDINRTSHNYHNKDLTLEEILNFDLYYEDLLSRNSKKLNPLKEMQLTTTINSILEQKFKNNIENILFFLINRDKYLTDIELLFCLRKIEEITQIKEFKQTNEDIYLNIIDFIREFSFTTPNKLLTYVKIYQKWEINDSEIMNHFLSSLHLQLTKCQNGPQINSENLLILIEAFSLLLKMKKVDLKSPKEMELILNITKFLMKNIETLSYEEIYKFFTDLHSNNILINYNHLDKFDGFFFEYKEKLSFVEAINIVYIFAKNKYSKGLFLQYFNSSFQQDNISSFELSKLLWALSQQDQSIIMESLWQKLEGILLKNLEGKQIASRDLVIVLQALNHSGKGSKEFWSYFSVENIVKLNLKVNEIFIIAINQQKFNHFEKNIINCLVDLFENDDNKGNKEEKFYFVKEISDVETKLIYQVVVLGLHKLLTENKRKNIKREINFLYKLTKEILRKYFSEDQFYKQLALNEMISLYKLLTIAKEICDKIKLVGELEILSRKILRQFEKIELEQIAKLMIFLEYFEKDNNEIDFTFADKLNERFSKFALEISDIKLLYLIPIFWKYSYSNQKIWLILQIKFIDNFEFLQFSSNFIPVLIFDKMECRKGLKENASFWEMIYQNYEMIGLLENQQFEDFLKNTLKNSIFSVKLRKNPKINNSESDSNGKFIDELFENAGQTYNLTVKEVLSEDKIKLELTQSLNDLLK